MQKLDGNFILDATAMDDVDIHEIIRDDVKQNRIQYLFPSGLKKVDLLEECRALSKLDDFDTMYDLTMQMLEGKSLTILLIHDDGTKSELCTFQITDKFMDLRGIDVIDQFPILINWLTEFIGASLLKKYPTPLETAPQPKESGKHKRKDKKAVKEHKIK